MAFKVTTTYTGLKDNPEYVDADSAEDFRLKYAITPFYKENYDPWSWQYFMKGNEDFAADTDNIARQREHVNKTFDPVNQIYTVENIYDSEGSFEHIMSIIEERKTVLADLMTQYSQDLYDADDTADFNEHVRHRSTLFSKVWTFDSDYSG